MEQFIVTGGNQLSGEITPSGNKNEALPVLAATLLTEEPIFLSNVPNIADVMDMKEILGEIGVSIAHSGENTLRFQAEKITHAKFTFEKASRIRGSFLLAGPMLARYGKIHLPSPGGDKIGIRPVNTHLLALQSLGASIELNQGIYEMSASTLTGTEIFLDEASVMGTENTVMAAVLAKGTTKIHNAASEPHVQGLCHLLTKMGANIQGIGSNILKIEGVAQLHGCEYEIQPDHTEVGSFIGLAAVTKSEIFIRKAGVRYLRMIRMMFQRLGVETQIINQDDLLVLGNQSLQIQTEPNQGIPKIDDAPWPGFPADLVSIMTVTATQCHGTVLIFEKMFESRLFWVDKLISMGAKIILCDPHRAVVTGPSTLSGTTLFSPDIRAGMSLLIAALGANGTSVIQNIHQIDRGYEKIDERLNRLGAKIQRIST